MEKGNFAGLFSVAFDIGNQAPGRAPGMVQNAPRCVVRGPRTTCQASRPVPEGIAQRRAAKLGRYRWGWPDWKIQSGLGLGLAYNVPMSARC